MLCDWMLGKQTGYHKDMVYISRCNILKLDFIIKYGST